MAENSTDESKASFDMTKTRWSIEDVVEEVEELGDDPEAQYYYTTYSDVFHTTPRCPHIQESENLHVTGLRSRLNGPLVAGANRVAGPTDEHCDLRECNWCKENGGWHPMEHPNKARPNETETKQDNA